MELNNVIAFDLETTGVDTSTDRIVQICAIKIVNGEKEMKTVLMNPTIKIPKEASDVHGITDEMVKDAPTFKQYSQALYKFFKGCDILGYNSNRFDVPLLREEFARCGMVFPEKEDVNLIDVMLLERKLNPNTLEAVYKRYTGKSLEGAHDAENDVLGTLEVFEHQLRNDEMNAITSAKEIDDMLQGDKKRVDFSGKLYEKDGEVYYAFGKHMDCKVRDHIGYAEWMLNGSFSRDTKMALSKVINK